MSDDALCPQEGVAGAVRGALARLAGESRP